LTVGDSDAVEMGTIALMPHRGDLPNPISIDFDNTVTLISYDVDARSLSAGDTLRLQTYWHITQPIEQLWAYVHIVDSDGQVWALADSVILPFTTTWLPEKVNGETRYITLSPDTPAGQYTVVFGLTRVNDQGQARLPILAADGHGLGDQIELVKIRIK